MCGDLRGEGFAVKALSATPDLCHKVDSWRTGEALQQPLTRPVRIVGPTEVAARDEVGLCNEADGADTATRGEGDLCARIWGDSTLISLGLTWTTVWARGGRGRLCNSH